MMLQALRSKIFMWRKDDEAMASVEAAMIFPVMLTLCMGVFDLGNAILATQKSIRASQVVADLIARQNIVDENDKDEAIEAGRLAFEPLDSSSYGVDIVSIGFDDDGDMYEAWRRTENMTAVADVEGAVEALEAPGEGVVMVTVTYAFEPLFAGFVLNSFNISERAFSRGRSSPVVRDE